MAGHVAEHHVTSGPEVNVEPAALPRLAGFERARRDALQGVLVHREAIGAKRETRTVGSDEDQLVSDRSAILHRQGETPGAGTLGRRDVKVALAHLERGRVRWCRLLRPAPRCCKKGGRADNEHRQPIRLVSHLLEIGRSDAIL